MPIKLTKRLVVGWIKSFSYPQNDFRSTKAAFIGLLAGWKWIINKKNDDGYNPFLK